MKTNCIIICAGEQTRWKHHLGTNKHLITIGGERLLDRTIRLIHEYFEDVEINIIALTDEYKSDKANLYVPKINSLNLGLDKFLSSRELWKEDQRNIIFYGDVWFSENCMKIISATEKRDWFLFARYDHSFLYSKGGECFAFSFYGNHISHFDLAMKNLILKCQEEPSSAVGGWMLYRELEGFNHKEHLLGKHLIRINDLTEDFDYPEDYEMWIKQYNLERIK